MAATHVVNVDLAKVYQGSDRQSRYLTTLAWGDEIEVKEITGKHVAVVATGFEKEPDGSVRWKRVNGFIRAPRGVKPADIVLAKSDSRVLKVDFVDVQQGDAAVIESPRGQVVLVDGGDNELFARYLASRYKGTTAENPRDVEAVVVTHGDADHFVGLAEIQASESNAAAHKRLFIRPKRVYHNGLVKRPTTVEGKRVPEEKLLGRTRRAAGKLVVTQLEEDLLAVPDADMNAPFRRWKQVLGAYDRRHPITFRRLSRGDATAFDFLAAEEVEVEVLGPLLTTADGVTGLAFLGSPTERFASPPGATARFVGRSASHTINGHSLILRLSYGRASFLFAGDLNEEASAVLTEAHSSGELELRSDVLKVPHHGSGDFSAEFLAAVSPVVSVVSSGDESARKEYIHPRATLMAALGRSSRPDVTDPVVFVTELVAFFEAEGFVRPEFHKLQDGTAVVDDGQAVVNPRAKKPFFAFSRPAFGLVKVRTDGERLLVWTNSGQLGLKEAYAYDLTSAQPRRTELRRA